MTVNSVTFKGSVTLSSEEGKKTAMATQWKVNFKGTSALSFSSTKTYHVVILNEEKREGLLGRLSTTTSAYVTNTIPKKSDLSKSTLHTSSDTEVLNDHSGNPICSFKKTDLVDLGFPIDKAEFAKVNEISSALIKNIGDFLKTHLETTSASLKAEEKRAAPKPSEKEDAEKAAPEEAKAKEKPVADGKKDDTKPSEPSKGWTRPSLSNLCGRAMPLAVGFVSTAAALAIAHLFSSEGNIDPAIGTTL